MMRKFLSVVIFICMLAFMMSPAYVSSESDSNRFIVLFEESHMSDKAEQVLMEKGMDVEKFELTNGVVVRGNLNAIEALSKDLGIRHIEVDQEVMALAKPEKPPVTQPGQTVEWGINTVKATEVWNSYDGSGVKVAIIDTGIDTSHPDLAVQGGVNYVKRAKGYQDDNGHGTHVAGIVGALNNDLGVVGVAPNVDLFAVKVLDSRGSGYLSDVIRGIDWSVMNGMDVINMSLGANSGSIALEDALIKAENAGIISVAAAGNDASAIDFPGAYSSTIAVGAIDSQYNLATFSSVGSELDVVAPGVSILSTYKDGTYKVLNGTSMATPHVAGLAALFKEKNPGATLSDFRNLLQTTSTDLGDSGFDIEYGHGLPDAVLLLQ